MIKNIVAMDQWLGRIEKELSEFKSINDLIKDNGLYQSTGIEGIRPSKSSGFLVPSGWKIMSEAQTNSDLLKSLTYGAEAIKISSDQNIESLLKNVELDFVESLIVRKSLDVTKITNKDINNWPNAIIVQNIYEIFESKNDSIVACLNLIKDEVTNTIEPINIIVHYHFGKDFYKSINSLRAIRVLLQNLTAAIKVKANVKIISSPETQHPDFAKGLIYHTMGAMASVIGGTDFILLKEWNDNEEEARVAQNILHLLRHESFMDNAIDAAAGSYFFENATNQIVNNTWQGLIK